MASASPLRTCWNNTWPTFWLARRARVAALVTGLSSAFIAYQALVKGNDRTYTLVDNVLVYEIVQNYADAPVETRVHTQDAPVTVSLALLTALFFGCDALFFAITSFPSLCPYEAWVKARINPLQLVQFSISSTFSFLAVALVLGVRNSHAFATLAVMNIVTMLLGMFAELAFAWRQRASNTSRARRDRGIRDMLKSKWLSVLFIHRHWSMFVLACILHAVQWCVVAVSFFNSIRLSSESPPSFVYAIVFMMFAVHVYFAAAQAALFAGVPRSTVEAYNVIMSPLCKLVLGWLLFSNVLAP